MVQVSKQQSSKQQAVRLAKGGGRPCKGTIEPESLKKPVNGQTAGERVGRRKEDRSP